MSGSTNGTTAQLHIAVAEDDEGMGHWFEKVLGAMGHQVLFVAPGGHDLIRNANATPPDLVISDVRLPGLDGIAACEAVYRARPVPIILVSAYYDDDLIARSEQSHALAYLVKPVEAEDLRPAIALAMRRFQQMQDLKREADEARRLLEERKVIERAKGVVCQRLQTHESDAFRRLQRLASQRNCKLAEVAQAILAAEEVFSAIEHSGMRE